MTVPPNPSDPRGGWRPAPNFGGRADPASGSTPPPPPPPPPPRSSSPPGSASSPPPSSPSAAAPSPSSSTASSDPNAPAGDPSGVRFAATAILAAIGVLAFVAPWVTLKVDGEIFFSVTLSRTAAGVAENLQAAAGSPGWAIALVVLLVVIAVRVWGRSTAEEAAETAFVGGFVVLAALLATWLGRSVWLHTNELRDVFSAHMAWGYYVSIALAIALLVVPSSFTPNTDP